MLHKKCLIISKICSQEHVSHDSTKSIAKGHGHIRTNRIGFNSQRLSNKLRGAHITYRPLTNSAAYLATAKCAKMMINCN